jgi:hypothetical protein
MKILLLCLLFVGCSYSPSYYTIRDSYNTYAPVYAPQTTTQTTQPPTVKKKLPKKTKLTIIPFPYGGVR